MPPRRYNGGKRRYMVILLLLLVSFFVVYRSESSDTNCDVSIFQFSAYGDGEHDDGIAIRSALDYCMRVRSENGHTIVRLPSNMVFLSSPFNLTTRSTLHIGINSTLRATTDINHYPVVNILPSFGRARETNTTLRRASFIGAYHAHDVHITGGGTIDGQGDVWWLRFINKTLTHTRPRLVEFYECERVSVTHVHLRQSPFWTLHPVYSRHINISHVRITNDWPETMKNEMKLKKLEPPNTDGIDVNSCSDVSITNCEVTVGDDCVSIKSGIGRAGLLFDRASERISIDGLTCENGHGISMGSETSGSIRDVTINNVTFFHSSRALRLKSTRDRGGVVERVSFTNIHLVQVSKVALEINMLYKTKQELVPEFTGVDRLTPIFRNVKFVNISGGHPRLVGAMGCLPEMPCEGIYFEDINIEHSSRGVSCYNKGVPFITRGHIHPPLCEETYCPSWWLRRNFLPLIPKGTPGRMSCGVNVSDPSATRVRHLGD